MMVEASERQTRLVDGYGYDRQGKRVMRVEPLVNNGKTYNQFTSYFYGINGQVLGTGGASNIPNSAAGMGPVAADFGNVRFGGQVTDRLGTVRSGSATQYYPWGDPRNGCHGPVFTYNQDLEYANGIPGQNYADQRSYNSLAGGFYSPDPAGLGAVDLQNPATWNMYAYANDGRSRPSVHAPQGDAGIGQRQPHHDHHHHP